MNYLERFIGSAKDIKKIILISTVINKNCGLIEDCGLSDSEVDAIYEWLKCKLTLQVDEFYENGKNLKRLKFT